MIGMGEQKSDRRVKARMKPVPDEPQPRQKAASEDRPAPAKKTTKRPAKKAAKKS